MSHRASLEKDFNLLINRERLVEAKGIGTGRRGPRENRGGLLPMKKATGLKTIQRPGEGLETFKSQSSGKLDRDLVVVKKALEGSKINLDLVGHSHSNLKVNKGTKDLGTRGPVTGNVPIVARTTLQRGPNVSSAVQTKPQQLNQPVIIAIETFLLEVAHRPSAIEVPVARPQVYPGLPGDPRLLRHERLPQLQN